MHGRRWLLPAILLLGILLFPRGQARPAPIATAPTANAGAAAQPPPADGGRLITLLFDRRSDLYVMESSGAGAVRLTPDNVQAYAGWWSPDGARIAFVPYRSFPEPSDEIRVVNRDGTGMTIFQLPFAPVGAQWSPDGRSLLTYAACFQAPGAGIFLVSAADGAVTRIPLADDGCPVALAWSPDGSRIAFLALPKNEGVLHLYVAGADGAALRLAPDLNVGFVGPAWSPDEAWIAFVAGSSQFPRSELYIVRPDGSGLRRLSTDVYLMTDITWSPDSRCLVYAASGGPCREGCPTGPRMMVDIDSGEPQQLTASASVILGWLP